MQDSETNGTTSLDAELDRFRALPGTTDGFFRQLWEEHRLRYVGSEELDLCDELSARLAVAAMSQRRCILIGFPDPQPHRAAVLFATALLCFWWDTRQQNRPTKVLYLGSHIGIRDQLSAVKVATLSVDLGMIFDETHLNRHITEPRLGGNQAASSLPKVITVYSPADAGNVFAAYPPDLIAVDIGARSEVQWFCQATQYAKAHCVPLLCWGQNPLSQAFREFSSAGEVFTWPPQRTATILNDPVVLLGSQVREVTPILPVGEDADRYSDLLRDAIKLLASSRPQGRLAEHALAIHWQYVRLLESLQVPVEIYEAEAPRHWGLRRFEDIQRACQRFQDSCSQSAPALAPELQKASALLDEALALARAAEPPLWRLLATISMEEPPANSFRRIVFTSRARRDLFAYSLLARFNVSDDDLWAMNVQLSVPEELRAEFEVSNGLPLISTIIGVPSPAVAPKALPALLPSALEFVILRHQVSSLRRRLSEYGDKMHAPRISADGRSIAAINCRDTSPVFDVRAPATVDLGRGKLRQILATPKWIAASAQTEASELFDDLGRDDVTDSSEDASARPPTGSDESTDGDFSCDTALLVAFTDGSRVLFPCDAQAHVVARKDGRQVAEEKFVRALQKGDQIVFIQGQARQNLYDLLVHRVHKHPAFQIHLILVNRWQDDFISAFGRSTRIHSVHHLLDELQRRGSSIVSPVTLRNWLGRSTLCPDDEEDLRRLGDILDLHFIKQHYKRIAKAAARIRGLHRGLALRLNHWLEAGAALTQESDLIDNELGLKFSDFASSLVILRVQELQEIDGPFLRSRLGTLER